MDLNTGKEQEGFTKLNLTNNFAAGAAEDYRRRAGAGANWFFWIAALSLVNSVIALFDGNWSFLAGLGVTQVIDGLAHALAENFGSTAKIIALLLDVSVAGFFVVMGLMAKRGMTWAFVLGLVVYALDALILLLGPMWLSIAFHAYVIFRLYQGFAANNKAKALEAEAGMMTNNAPA